LLGLTLSLLIQKSTIKTTSLPIQKSTANYAAADSKISDKTPSLLIQKSTINYAAADSKISNQKLCCCRFRNRQPKTFPLPIQKSAAKLCRCRFRNRQPTVPVPIQNSAAMVESFRLYFSLFWVFTFSPPNKNFVLEIKGTRIDSATKF
jgi:hypothetical protein